MTAAKPSQAALPGGDSCDYAGGKFLLSDKGIYFAEAADEPDTAAKPLWICSPLRVRAKTRDASSNAWGRLLEWQDDDKIQHKWAMPAELMAGDGTAVIAELLDKGLVISPSKKARQLLTAYIQTWTINDRTRCVNRLGWHGDVYVLPDMAIGVGDGQVVFQNSHSIEPTFAVQGTLSEWRETVAALALGNSRMTFAICTAFAGALLEPAREESGGFHFRGNSSTGKTTGCEVAASVWGDPKKFKRSWRSTTNGLEGLASLHNDSLIVLDELGQIDAREAGEAAYLLANGKGKARANRSGTAREAASWRLLFLSAGEVSLSALMAQAGKKPTAGQEIRLAEIDADAGAAMGAFEELHGLENAGALAVALKRNAGTYYGAVGLEWLRRLVGDREHLGSVIEQGIRRFMDEHTAASGQAERVARRFGLVAVAGEMASRYGLTGWPEGEASAAAGKCLASWLANFGGTGAREDRTLLAQVKAFLEAHGSSRFEKIDGDESQRIPNRAGFYRANTDGAREYLVLPEVFKREMCSGFDGKFAVKVLTERGWLIPGSDRSTQKQRLPGMGPAWVYVFGGKVWEGEE
jgi:uncharacterized protein (DUF927 family)